MQVEVRYHLQRKVDHWITLVEDHEPETLVRICRSLNRLNKRMKGTPETFRVMKITKDPNIAAKKPFRPSWVH